MERNTTPDIISANKFQNNELSCPKCISEVKFNNEVNSAEVKHKMSTRLTSRKVKSLFLLLRTVIVKKWIILILLINFTCAKEQRFAIEPQDQSAIIGSRVILPCRVENKIGQLQWTKDDFGLGTHRHLNGYERYKMIGSDEEGDYSLDIRDVALEDDALYQCQVSSGPKGEPPIRSRYARLIVLVPPEAPRILQGSILQTVEDQEINLECVSIGGRPASEITWVDNDGGMLSQGVTYSAEPMLDGRRYTARSVLRLRPRRSHHNQTFTCQAQNTADRTYRTTEVVIKVQFAPKVRAFIKSGASNGRIQEGETLAMGCQAIANPSNVTYKWFINGDVLPGDIRNELAIHNISRKYNEAAIKCEVRNSVGKSADTKTLEISYAPSFKIKPQNVEGEIGSTVTLNCVLDGHPPPKLLWLRYEHERVIRVGKSSSLNVTVSEHTTGQYWCRGSVPGYRDIETVAVVFATGPPIMLTNHTQYGLEGHSVRVECISLSIPKPDYVVWSFGGNELNSFHDQDYAFLEETLPDRTTKSTLIIRRSESKHFGTYNCTVINSYGTDSIQILLIPDASIPLLFIISGASTIIIIILITMLVIMLCHHRNKNTKKPNITDIEKKVKDSDQTSSISDLKLELRHIEGSCDMDTTMGSETDLNPTLHLKSNLGLPLAGPVPLPEGFDNELMKQYQRYSGDFNQAINSLQLKSQTQPGYVPYVDYSRDYAPPDSLTGSLSRSIDGRVFQNQSPLQRQASCGRLGMVGPDVIPNPGVVFSGAEARYAATYANPYLGGSLCGSHRTHRSHVSAGSSPGSSMYNGSYTSQVNTNPSAKPPPPYYTLRNHNFSPPVTSSTSPSSSSSSRRITCSLTPSSTSSSAQPQVPKHSPRSSGSLYVLPASSHGKSQANHITAKGGTKPKSGTHV